MFNDLSFSQVPQEFSEVRSYDPEIICFFDTRDAIHICTSVLFVQHFVTLDQYWSGFGYLERYKFMSVQYNGGWFYNSYFR